MTIETGDIKSFPTVASLAGKTLFDADHRLMHEDLGKEITIIEYLLATPVDFTPVLHTTASPDFARGIGGGGVRGLSWGQGFRIGKWGWYEGTIRGGSTGFDKGNGMYFFGLPFEAFIPPTTYPIIGHATLASAADGRNRLANIHAGSPSAPTDGTKACFVLDRAPYFWMTGGALPTADPMLDLVAAGCDIHIHLNPYRLL